jgi:hypothetical protein
MSKKDELLKLQENVEEYVNRPKKTVPKPNRNLSNYRNMNSKDLKDVLEHFEDYE